MSTNVTIFEQPQIVPAYLLTSAAAKALAEQMEGGLAGRQINKLGLKNSKFRFVKQGTEIAVSSQPFLDVVIIAANPAVGRIWYEDAYDSDAVGKRPDCYSRTGVAPEADSPKLQSTVCATCPRNAVGSANSGKGKACSYKKRVVIVAPGKIDGDAYALDAGAMSMFGDDDPNARKYNLKSYIEALKANGLIVPAVITRLSFDDKESVPKLHFTPVRVLTEAEFRLVESRLTDPTVREMLDDIDNKTGEGKPVSVPAQIAAPIGNTGPVAPPPVQPQPVAAPAAAVAPPAAAVKARGRPRAVETAPAAAAPPNGSGVAPPAGFGFEAAPAAAPAAAQPAATQGPAGFAIDLDSFDQ